MNNAIKITKTNLRLNIPKPLWFMLLMSAVMLAPNYPRIVGAMFVVSFLSSVLGFIRENRSNDFFETLPVSSADIVKGIVMTVVSLELIYMLAMAAFAAVACFVPFMDGTIATAAVGFVGNAAFFGVAFVAYGVYNLTFITIYERKGRAPSSLALGIIFGLLAAAVPYGIVEAVVQTVPAVGEAINTFSLSTLWIRLLVLAAGAVVFMGLSVLAVRLSTLKKNKGKTI